MSPKMRYNRKAEEDGAEWTDVTTYESAGDGEDYYTFTLPQEKGK